MSHLEGFVSQLNGPKDIDWCRAAPLFMSEIEAMGGAERSILALGRWLHHHGRPSYLLTFRDRLGLARHAEFPLPTVQLAPTGGFRSKLAALQQHLRLGLTPLPPLTSGYQPALYASLAGRAPFHCLMHDTPSLFHPAAQRSPLQRLRLTVSHRLIARGFRRGGGRMIVTSTYLQQECRRDFGVDAAIARMGGLAHAHAFHPRPLAGQLRMLSVCRIEANKRIDWLLDALHALEHPPERGTEPLSSRLDWSLTLAGKGSQLEAMRARAEALGLADRIHFLGFVPDTALEALYREAHLFLMPAVQGYGIPAIEALQRGIPVLLHRDSGVSDLLLDTPWATVLHHGPEELRSCLEQMIAWLISGGPQTTPPPPNLPTEDTWAERVATLCGYL